MRVQFSYDQEEMVDATIRFLRRSKTFRSVGWQGMIFATLFCLLGIYVVFMVVLQNPYLAVITAVVSTLTNVVLLRTLHERGAEKRLRKFFREQYGEQNSSLATLNSRHKRFE
jgi:Flp pilus assembly protein TadB